ncbi:hypothetical protein [Pseudomonas sp. JL3]|uniref:hypothetical protein n=1 Tax=Pseudomonas sp. JL3 TaxID=2919943 RepID=UPI00285C4BEF|nr:hypothetical protein [Pseudomonas sp. JL3]MDR8366837.1 hypothetical protein [Pseudomonas sp. JL3]
MALKKNIQSFKKCSESDDLVGAYRLLVALELALKNQGLTSTGRSGHDVPGLLQSAAIAPSGAIAAQLIGYAATLRNQLQLITCVGLKTASQFVPADNYPYMRYARMDGDWGGVDETPQKVLKDLYAMCESVCSFLKANESSVGVIL